MQQICNPELCTGCAACANGCPKAAITMAADEKGFLRPVIAEDLCVDCGLCSRICPQNVRTAPTQEGKIYAALAVNEEVRAKSSSGGIFSLLAEKTLREGGVVFGAAMDGNLRVRHMMADTEEKLELLRGSKYVQSEIGDSYKQAKECLEQGRPVLFSGTPCQVDALQHFLGKEYEKLLTMDILCHGVPSPAVLRKFIESREQAAGKKVAKINFRDKDPGWSAFSTTLFFEDGTKEIDNSYYYFFVLDYCTRESCSRCLYSSTKREQDSLLNTEKRRKAGMRILVTGANGQLGHDVMNELLLRGHDAVASGSSPQYRGPEDGTPVTMAPFVQMYITDAEDVEAVFSRVRPDAVIHCSAWTAVDAAEEPENRGKVYALNVTGPRNLAAACAALDSSMMQVSLIDHQNYKGVHFSVC